MPIRRSIAIVAGVALAFTVMTSAPAHARAAERCLGNDEQRSVDAGAQYTDAQGTWTCEPGASGATSGGWVLRPAPSPTIAALSTPVTPGTKTGTGDASTISAMLPFLLGAAGISVAAIVAMFIVMRRMSRVPLTGALDVREVRRG